MQMDDKGRSIILVIVGLAFIIAGIVVGLMTGFSEVNSSINASKTGSSLLPIIGNTLMGYLVAGILLVVGMLLIVFGALG
ncbi:MAG: hypothetical protein NWF05_02325 [Candidatus Bathyarchaeota archaeon]|nr:hypothetical protein [Candidatus Bathyarchaeota archaeon]